MNVFPKYTTYILAFSHGDRQLKSFTKVVNLVRFDCNRWRIEYGNYNHKIRKIIFR